jgi:hypothetical protein
MVTSVTHVNAETEALATVLPSDVYASLDTDESFDSYVNSFTFAKLSPLLAKQICTLPTLPGIGGQPHHMAAYINELYELMNGQGEWSPAALRLTRKLDEEHPTYAIGTFRREGSMTPETMIDFLPLASYTVRNYWPPINKRAKADGSKLVWYCVSKHGVLGNWQKDGANDVLVCENCNYKEFGVQEDGTIKKDCNTAPLCTLSHIFLGTTPDFKHLYLFETKKYDDSKMRKSSLRLASRGRVNRSIPLSIPGMKEADVLKIPAKYAVLDAYSQWVPIAGEKITTENGASASINVGAPVRALTPEELAYAAVFRKLAMEFVQYHLSRMSKFYVEEETNPENATPVKVSDDHKAMDFDAIDEEA